MLLPPPKISRFFEMVSRHRAQTRWSLPRKSIAVSKWCHVSVHGRCGHCRENLSLFRNGVPPSCTDEVVTTTKKYTCLRNCPTPTLTHDLATHAKIQRSFQTAS